MPLPTLAGTVQPTYSTRAQEAWSRDGDRVAERERQEEDLGLEGSSIGPTRDIFSRPLPGPRVLPEQRPGTNRTSVPVRHTAGPDPRLRERERERERERASERETAPRKCSYKEQFPPRPPSLQLLGSAGQVSSRFLLSLRKLPDRKSPPPYSRLSHAVAATDLSYPQRSPP